MKRLLCFILVVATLLSLCSCGKKGEASAKPEQTKIDLPNMEKGMPSKETILQDVKDTILADNSHIISVSEIETVKSLTEDTTFSLDVTANAESKYSDWEYEVSLYYRKYDQGWMLDNARAISLTNKLVRTPSDEEMIEIVNTDHYLLNEWSKILPIDNGSISGNIDFENEILTFCFTGSVPVKHANEITEYTSLWKFDAWEDTWEFEVASDNHDFVDRKIYYEVTSDFTGHWDNGSYGTIDIVRFSKERIEIMWDGLDSPMVFTLSVNPLEGKKEGASTDPKDYGQSWYSGENGYTLYMDYNENHTYVIVYESVSLTKIVAPYMIDVQQDLPELS